MAKGDGEEGGGVRQLPEKKKNVQLPLVPHQAQPTQRDGAQQGQRNSEKKKKSGTQRNKHTNSEGIRKERRQKGTKRKNRGARCFSHTRCAAHVELQSVTRNEGKRKKQHMRNQPSTDATVHRRKKP